MAKTKTFDCVEMKNEIQRKLAEEYAGLTTEERTQRMREKLRTSDSPAAQWYRKVMAAKKAD